MIFKSVKYAAPYRSSTFNSDKQLAQGLNGVVSGGQTTTSGGVVTIQPLTFVQNGLFATSNGALSTALPPGLVAPYFAVVTTSSPTEDPAEIITPTFAQRPEDISANSVIVAEWDGQEWRSPPKLQLGEVLAAIRARAVAQQFSGVASGFDISIGAGPSLNVAPGTVIDRQGQATTKTQTVNFPTIPADFGGLPRVDQVLYRRPDDSPDRSGVLEFLPGAIYNPTLPYQNLIVTTLGDDTKVNQIAKTLNDPSGNAFYFLFIEDYGTRSTLVFQSTTDSMAVVTGAVDIATNLTYFDAILNPGGSIDIVYTRGTSLYYQRVSNTGASIFAETLIATGGTALIKPKLVAISTMGVVFLHVVYELVVSGSVHQLFYVRLTNANAIVTNPQLLVDLSSIVANASLAADSTDSLFYLAYENTTTQRVYLRGYDAGTPTLSTPPTQVGTTLELENDTLILNGDTVAPIASSNPVVKVADNKDVLVFWLQSKGITTGVAVYSPRILGAFGHKAYIQDLTAPGEDIGMFAVDIDALGVAHISVEVSSEVKTSALEYDTANVTVSGGLTDASVPTGLGMVFTTRGALVQTIAETSSGFSNNGPTKGITFFGPGTFMTEPITAVEFVMTEADYNSLPLAPTTGDQLIITSAGANNGTYPFVSVRFFTESLVNYAAVSVTIVSFDNSVGSGTVQFQTETGNVTQFTKSTAGALDNIRSPYLTPTDIYVGSYRTSDGVLAVSDTAIAESISISRLYEWNNLLASGGGQISWSVIALSNFAWTMALTFNFFNRESTYTIAANPGGITIGPDQILYVQIPDEDVPATLTPQVVDIGAGLLDRGGRTSVALFWNIGGTLYTRWAPFAIPAVTETTFSSSAGGSGGSGAPVSPDILYHLGVFDQLANAPGGGTSMLDPTISNGEFSPALMKLECDKTRTCTTVGTAYTLSANPSYTVEVGDIIFDQISQTFRRIVTVSTQSTGVLASAFTVDLSSNSVMVSQAAWTIELTHAGDAAASLRPIDINGVEDVIQILVQYQDSVILGDKFFDMSNPAEVVVAASNEGLSTDFGQPLENTYSVFQARPTGDAGYTDLELPTNTHQERLFVVFFPSPTNGTVTAQANLLGFFTNFYVNTTLTPVNNGGILNSAYCMSDSSGTPNGCSNPTIVGGKTQVTLNFSYVPGLNAGTPDGALQVEVEGSIIPRFYTGIVGQYFTETSYDTITFSSNLSGLSYSIHIVQRQAAADFSSKNAARLSDTYVGSAIQVAAGAADYSSLQAAHDALVAIGNPAKIIFLVSSIIENVIWTASNITVEGKGRGSVLNGSLTFNSGAIGNLHRAMKINGNVAYAAGADGNFFSDAWVGATFALTDAGSGNQQRYIQET